MIHLFFIIDQDKMRNSSLLKWAQNNKTNKQGSVKSKDEKGKKYNCPKMSNSTYFTHNLNKKISLKQSIFIF